MKNKLIITLVFLVFLRGYTSAQTQKPKNPFPTQQKAPSTSTTKPTLPSIPAKTNPPETPSPTTQTPSTPAPIPVPQNDNRPYLPPITGTDSEQIIATICRVFDAMRWSDTMLAKPLFAPNCRLYTPVTNASGQTNLNEENLSSFMKAIGSSRKEILDERILKYKMDIDGPLAQVWADYNLYLGGKFIHCGIDVFHLYKSNQGWKIFELADTRRKTGCLADPKDEVTNLLDNWHLAAARTDADAYFGAMTADGVFLGTDATERWMRDEFKAWAKPQFDSKKGWNFKPSKRFISFSTDINTAWFDEELATWMGTCRGSGVVVKTENGWKIKQYNLTILVPNEKVQDYLKVIGLK